jgi:hypothetical protein
MKLLTEMAMEGSLMHEYLFMILFQKQAKIIQEKIPMLITVNLWVPMISSHDIPQTIRLLYFLMPAMRPRLM